MSETLIRCESASKVFCRDLKRSLWYGIKDIAGEVLGLRHESPLCSNDVQLRESEFWANRDVSFEVKRGQCLGLIGRNGAGKTTLLKMLNGLIKPDTGRIEMKGRVGALIALGAGFNPVLTGRENIFVNSSILGRTNAETRKLLPAIIDFAELDQFIDSPVKTYSSGMLVRLGFAIASFMTPDVLLVDEVLAVGDSGFRFKCYKKILELIQNNGTAVVLVSHQMFDIERVCNSAMLLENGEGTEFENAFDAVQRYHSLEKRKSVCGETIESSTGTSIDVSVPGGTKSCSISGGDKVVLRLQIRSGKPLINPRILVRFDTANGVPVSGFSNRVKDFSINVDSPGIAVDVTIPSLPFVGGRYGIYVGLYESDGLTFLCDSKREVTINVTTPVPDRYAGGYVGNVMLAHEWSTDE